MPRGVRDIHKYPSKRTLPDAGEDRYKGSGARVGAACINRAGTARGLLSPASTSTPTRATVDYDASSSPEEVERGTAVHVYIGEGALEEVERVGRGTDEKLSRKGEARRAHRGRGRAYSNPNDVSPLFHEISGGLAYCS